MRKDSDNRIKRVIFFFMAYPSANDKVANSPPREIRVSTIFGNPLGEARRGRSALLYHGHSNQPPPQSGFPHFPPILPRPPQSEGVIHSDPDSHALLTSQSIASQHRG